VTITTGAIYRRLEKSGSRAWWYVQRSRSARRLLRDVPTGSQLHLGCGQVHFDGWLNLDRDFRSSPDIRLDLRAGLPVASGTVSFIYSEHLIEHLTLSAGTRLFVDAAAGLEKGGVFRIAMPDLGYLVQKYLRNWQDQEWLADPVYRSIDSAAHMLNYSVREWGHLYLYDLDDLSSRLRTAGFDFVAQRQWGESPHKELRDLERRHDSKLIVEATK